MFDVGKADRLRRKGLKVVEVEGCHSRGGSDYSPWGHLFHHTATASLPLNQLIYGRSDLKGPLSTTAVDTDETVYVIACGKANHGGTGNWNGYSGNSRFSGTEVVHLGTSPLPDNLVEIACRVAAAELEAPGASHHGGYSCQHFEYATPHGRKIDIATNTDVDYFRNRTHYWIGRDYVPPTQPPVQENDMKPMLVVRPRDGAIFVVMDGRKKWMRNWDEIGQMIWNLAVAGNPVQTAKDNQPFTWLDWQVDILPPMVPATPVYTSGDDFGDPMEIRQARAHQIEDAVQGSYWSTHDILRGIHFHAFNADTEIDNVQATLDSRRKTTPPPAPSMTTDLAGKPTEFPDLPVVPV